MSLVQRSVILLPLLRVTISLLLCVMSVKDSLIPFLPSSTIRARNLSLASFSDVPSRSSEQLATAKRVAPSDGEYKPSIQFLLLYRPYQTFFVLLHLLLPMFLPKPL